MPERLLTVDPTLRRFQYRITAPLFAEHLSTIDVHDLGDGTSLVVYSVDAEPAALALVIGGAARAGLDGLPELLGVDRPRSPGATGRARPDHAEEEPADGPQDPPGHHRPAALRHPRLQRRHPGPHPGGRRAGRRGHPLRAGPPPVGGVHAVALDHPDRPAPEHPRRVDERGAAARSTPRRWPRCCTAPATAPPWSARPTSSRSSTRSSASTRTPWPGPGPTPPGGLHRGFEHLEMATHGAIGPAPLRPVADGRAPRGARRVLPGPRRLPAGQRGRRRRHRRPPGQGQPDRPRDLPHRLGGRPDHRLARLASAPTTTGSAG